MLRNVSVFLDYILRSLRKCCMHIDKDTRYTFKLVTKYIMCND